MIFVFLISLCAIFSFTFFCGGQNFFASLVVSFILSALITVITSKVKQLVKYIKLRNEIMVKPEKALKHDEVKEND